MTTIWRGVLVILAVVLVVLGAGCKPSPKNVAEGYAIESEADEDAADRGQQRQFNEDHHAFEMARLEWLKEVRDALTPFWIFAKKAWIVSITIGGAIGALTGILAVAFALAYTLIGSSRAAVKAANLRATTVPMNAKTRQYPLLVSEDAEGTWRVLNPNTNAVTVVKAIQAPDPQMITGASATQLAGVVAQEAARAAKLGKGDPAGAATGVAAVNPPLVLRQITDGGERRHDAKES
jgi:hypothetical protein